MWGQPEKYVEVLSMFAGGFSPDFSMLYDMPIVLQLYNCWRNRVLAYYLQQCGVRIIPNACWGSWETLEWAFNGLPNNSDLSITTQGCFKDEYAKYLLINGLHKLVREKCPTKIYVYGKFPDEWRKRFNVPFVVLKSFAEERWG